MSSTSESLHLNRPPGISPEFPTQSSTRSSTVPDKPPRQPPKQAKLRFIGGLLPASFRFSPWITCVALFLSTIMLVASHWQWDRYKYKIHLLQSFRQNSLTTPVSFPPVGIAARHLPQAEELREKKLSLSGVYDYEHQLIITNREGQIGNSVGPGYLLFTPLRLNGGAGPAILVNRGFIPFAEREPQSWGKYSFADGSVQVDGVLASSVAPSFAAPRNPYSKKGPGEKFQRLWFFEEVPAMAKQLPYPVLENVYLQLLGGPPHGEFPREAVRIQVPPTTHFGYTIEWILLAIVTWVLAIFFQCYSFKSRGMRKAAALCFLACGLSAGTAAAAESPEQVEQQIGIVQHLGATIDLNLPFSGIDGREQPLREFAVPGKPFLIVPVYYGCPRLCTLTFDGVAELLREQKLKLGTDFSVIAFSIDPTETPAMAAEKAKSVYEKLAPRTASEKDFPFLVGPEASIKALTGKLGFLYQQDGMDFAHSPGLMVVTAEGTISRYFLGVQYPESDVRYSLVEAANGEIGGFAEQVFLYCFRFDPTKGKYTPAAWRLMRAVSGLGAVLLAAFLIVLWRREFHNSSQVSMGPLDVPGSADPGFPASDSAPPGSSSSPESLHRL